MNGSVFEIQAFISGQKKKERGTITPLLFISPILSVCCHSPVTPPSNFLITIFLPLPLVHDSIFPPLIHQVASERKRDESGGKWDREDSSKGLSSILNQSPGMKLCNAGCWAKDTLSPLKFYCNYNVLPFLIIVNITAFIITSLNSTFTTWILLCLMWVKPSDDLYL